MNKALICISTQQEVANLLPALAMKVDRVYTLATPHAEAQRWPEQLKSALASAQIPLEVWAVDDRQASSPATLSALVLEHIHALLAKEDLTLIFAWGGGQKPQSAGLWMAFSQLKGPHQAVYWDAHRGTCLTWCADDITSPAHTTAQVNPSLKQLLAVNGLQLTPKHTAQRCWPDQDSTSWPQGLSEAYVLFSQDEDFRRLCFEFYLGAAERADAPTTLEELIDLARLKDSFTQALQLIPDKWFKHDRLTTSWSDTHQFLTDSVVPRMRKLYIQAHKQQQQTAPVAPPQSEPTAAYFTQLSEGKPLNWQAGRYPLARSPIERFPKLFEAMLTWRVAQWAEQNPTLVSQVWSNVEVCRIGDESVFAEFDVVIIDRVGRVIILDAKTGGQDNQGARAQSFAAQHLGGSFGKRFAVYPMYQSDIGEPSNATEPKTWGAKPWYPKPLLRQIAHWRDDQSHREALQLLPFDETDTLEHRLNQLCAAASP